MEMEMINVIDDVLDIDDDPIDNGANDHVEIHPCFFRGILFSSRLVNYIKEFANVIYNSHPFIKRTIDYIDYQFRAGQSCMTNRRIEPLDNNWISIGWLGTDPSIAFGSDPSFGLGTDPSFGLGTGLCVGGTDQSIRYFLNTRMFSDLDQYADKNTTIKNAIISNRDSMLHPWVQIKVEIQNPNDSNPTQVLNHAIYISRNLETSNIDSNIFYSRDFLLENATKLAHYNRPSSARFLSIQYVHDKMNAPIVLELDPAYFYEKNELFMPAFILHLLEHQGEPFYFDMAYTLHIIDNQINIFELKSTKYIILNRYSYDIRNLYK
jgi:hypothetical protein